MYEDAITPEDVQNLSVKLEKFAAGLPHQEQHVLDWLLSRARACNDEHLAATELSEAELEAVVGGADATPLNSRLASALGMETDDDRSEISVMVSWTR
jgi:hypothetical protein